MPFSPVFPGNAHARERQRDIGIKLFGLRRRNVDILRRASETNALTINREIRETNSWMPALRFAPDSDDFFIEYRQAGLRSLLHQTHRSAKRRRLRRAHVKIAVLFPRQQETPVTEWRDNRHTGGGTAAHGIHAEHLGG